MKQNTKGMTDQQVKEKIYKDSVTLLCANMELDQINSLHFLTKFVKNLEEERKKLVEDFGRGH